MSTPPVVIKRDVFDHFPLHLHVDIRMCVKDDLPDLEWFGLFTEHREIFLKVFDSQERGETLMLVAEVNTLPIGQTWIDLVKRKEESAGFIWALRVIPWLQNLGIGGKLMAAAEARCKELGLAYAELGVEKENHAAKRFYERLGYRMIGSMIDDYSYTSPQGQLITVPMDVWMLRKKLRNSNGHGSNQVNR
ncbi:MAG: family N-acetyltransferase [Verrucomicrobiales bacterium]|nr:family N-acetyltransferase [Verrucomicrobiales bacterium]